MKGPLLKTFYDSVVASAIFYGVVCWGGNISAGDRKRLNRLIRRASSVLGRPLDPVEVVSDRRMVAKLSSLLDNISHPMHETVTALSSSFSGCGTHGVGRRDFAGLSSPLLSDSTIKTFAADQTHKPTHVQ